MLLELNVTKYLLPKGVCQKLGSNALFPELIDFSNPYFTTQLITYIGNKRALLPFLNSNIEEVKKRLSKNKLVMFDGFSGSGVVSRLLKYHASQLWVNDLEDYCEIINKCYLANKSEVDINFITETIHWLNDNKLKVRRMKHGFIERNYAPKNDKDIKIGERVFYTNENAKIIDNIRYLINTNIGGNDRVFPLASLIVEASIHTNTSGVFKGFHKKNRIGCFGGRGENALTRIKKQISLEVPILSDVECEVNIRKADVNKLIKSPAIPKEFDLVYYDPPYNQHPYGSNYFMLNIIANGAEGVEIQDGISGIVKGWNRSLYNKRNEAKIAFDDLIAHTPAKYILISYNSEGFISISDFCTILKKYGDFYLKKQEYNTYRGCRNLRNRSIKTEELLWVLKKK
jgi:adenine-specific DNA-methyltransferase